MKLYRSWAAALALVWMATPAAVAQNAGSASETTTALYEAGSGSQTGDLQLTSLSLGGGGIPMVQPGCGQFFAGAEYLYVRALPSEAISFLEFNAPAGTDTFHQFDFNHNSNFRVYGGYRLCNCGEEIRFTYTRFDSDATADTGPVPPGANITFLSPLDIPAINPGERITASANVELNNFDIGWSKTIPLGCPMTCCADPCCGDSCGDCCDDYCGDSCGSLCGCDPCGCWCPAWDITYTAALRIADFSSERVYESFDATNAFLERGTTRIDFSGVGGRVGLQGRRYLGKSGIASLYMKGDISLLVGDVDLVNQNFDGVITTTQQISCTHVIPVSEIEAGGTVFLTCNTSVSGGYFIGAWHDLGFREDYNFGLPVQYDDANIMGFDGFFVRLESSF